MKINLLFEQLIAKQHLTIAQMKELMRACMSGELSDPQIAGFLTLMRAKGETVEELSTAAQIMREFAVPIDLGKQLIDIVGTGGDGKNTFNVSTACSFVVAATGIAVAKHGNRSVSSKSGSTDLLEQAGFSLDLNEQQTKKCLEQCNLAFLFAPTYHPAMSHARYARQQLGIRTLFNLLGPLVNPAHVSKQVVGVFSPIWLKPLATVLAHLGSERALVVSSDDGLDEISIAAPTQVLEYHQGSYTNWTINPSDYGISHPNLDAIIVDSPKQSLELIQAVFSGERGAARDMVLLNSAAAVYCAKQSTSFAQALEQVAHTIDSGNAAQVFSTLRDLTQKLTKEAQHD
jgi:anthranilate phosphoribosyltransferase